MDLFTNAPSDEDLVDIISAEEERAKNIEDKVAVDAGETPAPAAPAISDLDLVDISLENEQRAQQIETSIAVDQNKAIKPEDQARAIRIAEREKLPVDVVRRNLDQFEDDPLDPQRLQSETPSLAKLATTPYGPITQYDVETMGWLERFFRGSGQSFESGVEGLEVSDIGYKWRQGQATPEDLARLKELRDAQKQNVDYRLGVVGDLIQYPVQSAPATAATVIRTWDEVLLGAGTGLAAGAVTGPGAIAGATTGAGIGARVGFVKESFEQLAGNAYVEAMFSLDADGNPLDEDTAYAISTFAGSIGAVAELLPFEKALDTMPFLKGVVGKEGARRLAGLATQNPAVRASLARMGRVLKVGGAEAFTEVIQEATKLESIIAAGGVTDEQGNVLADQRLERYGEAAVGGFAGGTTLGAAGEAVTATVDKVQSVRAKRAEAKQQALVELGDRIRTSKVGTISPETVVAHAKQMDADGAAPTMSAPAEALVQLFQSEGLTPEQVQTQFPAVAQAIEEAAQTGAEVALNAETVVKLARLEKFADITGDIRTAPGELTANEAKQADTELNQMLESMSEEDIAKAVNASVHKDVMNQLVAAGTDPKVAETQAKLFTSVISNLAERTGMQPDELLKRYGLTITGNESTDTATSDPNATMLSQRDPAYGEPAIKINGQVLKASDFFPNWQKGSRPEAGRGLMSIADEQAMEDVDLGPGMPEDPFWGHVDLLNKAREAFGADVVDAAIESDPEAGFGMVNAAGDFQSLKAAAQPQDQTLYQSAPNASAVSDFIGKLNRREQALVNPIYTNKVPAKKLKGNEAAAQWLEKNFVGSPVKDFTKEIDDAVLREIGNVMAAEAVYALQKSGNAYDWYSEAMQRALRIAQIKWPSLGDDAAANDAGFGTAANARFVFTYIMAVTSQNLDVAANATATNKAFDEMLKRVKAGDYTMSKAWGTGDKQAAMGENFAKFGPLINAMPGADFPEKLTRLNNLFRRKMTVAEWVREMKADGVPFNPPGQTAMDAIVYGSSLLGPKIGNGFWQNLNGNFSPLTIDLWMRRTWGRLTGKSIGNEAALPAQRARLKGSILRAINSPERDMDPLLSTITERRSVNAKIRALEARSDLTKKVKTAEIKKLNARLGELEDIAADYRGIPAPEPWKKAYDTDNAQLAAYAKRLLGVWNKEYKRLREKYPGGVPAKLQPTWARAAKRLKADLTTPLDQVANGTQRRQIEKAVGYAQQTLTDLGFNVTTADLQAILWYPEKELWGALTSALAVDEDGDPVIPPSPLNESYDTVFTRILNAEGYDTRTEQGAAGDQAGGGDGGTVAGGPDAGSGPDGPAGEVVLRQDVRAAGAGTDQVNRGPQAGPSSSLASVEALAATLGVSLDVSESKGAITLSKMMAATRNQGTGTKVMEALAAYADATGQPIKLGASSQLGGDKARLIEFYKRFGFAPDKRTAPASAKWKDTAMTRQPKASGTTLYQRAETTQTFARGSISFTPARDKFRITLTGKADLSTFMHESAHYFLEVLQDLVEKGNAPQQIMEDLGVIRRWAGVPMGGKIERVHHEKFARGFEAYLMEGRAPSTDLQSVFNRFRAWLTFIYKKLTALNVELTDEVRGVMDRLVASDREIADARTSIGWSKPLPKEALYLSDDEYDRYVDAWNKANEAQQREVDAKLMLEAAREAQIAWKEERRKVFDEEKKKLAQTRGYRAWKLLSEGEGLEAVRPGWSNIKIDPASIPSEWRRDAAGMTAPATESGLPLDTVAEILGFNTGEEMLSTIAGAKYANRELPRQVQKIMDERHGALDMTALADLAMQAVHSDKTQEVLLTEYRAMASAARIPAVPVGMTKWMAAQAERRVLALTRRQLDPTRWRRAELKAAEQSAKAAAAGDATKAAVYKRQQMMAAAMYKATVDGQKRVETIRNKLMPFTKNDRRAKLGKAGDLYLDGIDEILEGIKLKPMSAKSVQQLDRLAKLVEEADKKGEPLVLPDKLRAMLGKKNFADMTLEELEGVHDSVMNIWHLAKTKNELRARKEKRDLEQALTEMEANAQAALGDPKVQESFVKSRLDKAREWVQWGRAQLIKMEFLFGWLDGKPSGGLMHRYIYQPLADANREEYAILKRFNVELFDRLRSMPAEQKARWDSKRTFMGRQANGATIISAALNLGNEGNKQKLLEGYGWNEQRLMAEINAFMTKADWDLVQHIWDEIDTLWPKIEATTKAATGLAPEKVVPSPIVTPFGTYAGGYYPVVYDPDQVEQAFKNQQKEGDLFSNNFARPTLGDGFTKARVQYAAPILLDIAVISRHLSEVVHYVTHYEAVTQANKITSHPRFQKIVKEHMGLAFTRELRPWLQDIAKAQDTPGVTQREILSSAMRSLRGGVSIASMGYNIFTGFTQLLGVTTALDAVKPRFWASGVQKAWLSPRAAENWRFAWQNSAELEPLVKQVDRDIAMINDIYMKKTSGKVMDAVVRHAFTHIGYFQLAVNMAAWHGAYEQALSKGLDQKAAIDEADSVVRKTQSSGAIKDLSAVQRGSEASRMVSMFYSWFSVLYNRLEDIARETKSIKDVPKAARRLAILVFLSAMMEETFSRAYQAIVGSGEDEEDEKGFLLTVGLKGADMIVATVPLLRAFVSVEGATGGFTPEISPVMRVGADYWRMVEGLKGLVVDQELPTKGEVKSAVKTISVVTGKPVFGVYRLGEEFYNSKIFD